MLLSELSDQISFCLVNPLTQLESFPLCVFQRLSVILQDAQITRQGIFRFTVSNPARHAILHVNGIDGSIENGDPPFNERRIVSFKIEFLWLTTLNKNELFNSPLVIGGNIM